MPGSILVKLVLVGNFFQGKKLFLENDTTLGVKTIRVDVKTWEERKEEEARMRRKERK